ncbi:hypothetical protein, partial [Rhizobium tibeticum]|uniref:hypothetical protein n=1 Tax=Rhizobium tibeticum TaxID=501024 RepID=UPI001ABF1118
LNVCGIVEIRIRRLKTTAQYQSPGDPRNNALGNGADGHAFLAAKRVMRVRNLTAAAKMSGSVQPAILGTLEAFQA